MRLVKDITGTRKDFHIRGTNITVNFNDGYTRVDEAYLHHFQTPGFEILPVGATIPTVDVKVEKVDNKDIKTESLDKKS